MNIIPSGPELARQIVIGLVVSIAAAAILARVPELRAWVNNEPRA